MKRTLKRLDLTARTFFALIEPGSAFAGSLFELALAADRSYMLDDAGGSNRIWTSEMNAGLLPMGNGLARLRARFPDDPDKAAELSRGQPFRAREAQDAGLVTFAPDDIDWEDEVRQAVEARAALSPDALTGTRGQPPVRRPRNARDEDLRPPDGVAELDLPAAERRGRAWCARGVRRAGHARVRLEAHLMETAVVLAPSGALRGRT